MFNTDQASGLRHLFARQGPEVTVIFGGAREQAPLAVASALRLAEDKANVLLIDGTSGDLAAVVKQALRYELNHVLAGDKPLAAVMQEVAPRVRLLPAMRGIERLAHLDAQSAAHLLAEFQATFARAAQNVDAIIVNAKSYGAHHALQSFGRDARLVVSLTEGSEGLTRAYQELKALRRAVAFESVEVAQQQASTSAFAVECLYSLKNASERFLGITVEPLTARLSEELEGAKSLALASARTMGFSPTQQQPWERHCVALC